MATATCAKCGRPRAGGAGTMICKWCASAAKTAASSAARIAAAAKRREERFFPVEPE